jgi:hypothetical protein
MNEHASIETIRAESYFPKRHFGLRHVDLDARVADEVRAALLNGYRLDPQDVREWYLCQAQEAIDNPDEHSARTLEIAHAWLGIEDAQVAERMRGYNTRSIVAFVREMVSCRHEYCLNHWCTKCGAQRRNDGSWLVPHVIGDLAYHAARLPEVAP